MDEDALKIRREVGKVSYEALLKARDMIKPGAKLLDVAEKTEAYAKEKGFGCAFPLNLSVDDEAAHYTPSIGDEKVFGENDIVKVDFGAEKNGLLGDCALTVDLSGKYTELVEASRSALDAAIDAIRPGVEFRAVGAEIQKAIEAKGFRPILNLGGHGVEEHNLHAGTFIPNYDNGDDTLFEEDMVIAIEPFATNGKKNLIIESDICDIYSLNGIGSVRSGDARKLLEEISRKYNSEPFAVRWLAGVLGSKFATYAAIGELTRNGILEPHPMLLGTGVITQAEAEVIVTEGSCEVLTKT